MEEWTEDKSWPFYPSGDGKTLKITSPIHIILENSLRTTPFYDKGYVYWYPLEKEGKLVRKPVPSFDSLIRMIDICDELYSSCISLPLSKSAKIVQKFVFDLQNALKRFPTRKVLDPLLNGKSMEETIKASRLIRKLSEEDKRKIVEMRDLYKRIDI